jgi:hypothetical protein
LFPPSNKFYDLVQGENFKQFLSIKGTTKDGQNAIAQQYGVLDKWTASNHEDDHVKTYYELLLLVKTRARMIRCGSVSLEAYIATLLFLRASFA